MKKRPAPRAEMILFFALLALTALGNGLSDSVYGNYFKDVYHVSATQRAFIEFPRETPGLLCALVIAALSLIGDLKISVVAQVLACLGVTALGLFTPSYGLMLIFLFMNSMGMHLFMPLQDSIGMSLAEPDRVGQRMGQYASLKCVVATLAAMLVFFGFRSGWLSFQAAPWQGSLLGVPVRLEPRLIFLISGAAFGLAIVAAALLERVHRRSATLPDRDAPKVRFVFRKRYKYYYLLTVLHGVQKQIAYVFGSWVIIDLMLKGADVMAVLCIVSSFLGIFFLQYVGKWMDRFGIKKMMYVDALTFICVYVLYGLVVWGITDRVLPSAGWPVMMIYCIFVLDRLSMQIGIVKSVYLRAIALTPEDVTATLSTGTSLDHVVAILAAQVSGFVWESAGPQWVFFTAAFFSLGNLFVAWRITEPAGAPPRAPAGA